MRIHHTQVKQAAALGYAVEIKDEQAVFTNKTTGETIVTSDVKATLAALLAKAPKAKKPRKVGPPKPRKARRVRDEDEAEDDEAEAEDEDEDASRSVVKAKYKAIYGARKDELKNTNGDAFAKAFRAETTAEDSGDLDVNALVGVAKANGIDAKPYLLNRNRGWEGRARMSIGNRLRGMQRRGVDVTVGSQTFKGLPVKPKAKRVRKAKPKSAK